MKKKEFPEIKLVYRTSEGIQPVRFLGPEYYTAHYILQLKNIIRAPRGKKIRRAQRKKF